MLTLLLPGDKAAQFNRELSPHRVTSAFVHALLDAAFIVFPRVLFLFYIVFHYFALEFSLYASILILIF